MSIITSIRRLTLTATMMGFALVGTAAAQDGQTTVNVTKDGVAIHGYDAVAYFTEAKPVVGSASFTATHEGATYRFSSAANRAAFVAQPARYAPQFGGYCAMGVAVGKKLDVDPTLFRVVEDKLYLNVNKDAQGMWLKEPVKHIGTASKRWKTVAAHKGFDTM